MKYTKRIRYDETIQKVFNSYDKAKEYFRTDDIVAVVSWNEWQKMRCWS